MTGSTPRLRAVSAVTNYRPTSPPLNFAQTPTAELFGINVFNDSAMRKRLPEDVYQSLKKTIDNGDKLDTSIADVVAGAMKDWAIERGATHYAHVFYPLTGQTAEKHDSFLTPDGKGGAMTEFSGKQLIQGEPDASSFPSGGLRPTFEARGYTAWDVTSHAYILENPNGTTLCIPTAFIAWTGEALDKKTPLLRSMKVLSVQAQRLLALFGHEKIDTVKATAGAEQEYFLVDRNFYFARPDLISAGRTLFGNRPPKGQEFEDHYFGAIPDRVLACMLETERELFKLGVPIKTRHNEVAPGQYEIAPIYENANQATDHQQLVMIMLRRVAQQYGMECLTHEKPFAGLNGSGKHLNWSLGNATQGNLLDPGDTPHENAQFLTMCAAVIRAVHKFSPLLRAVVATAGNDHRLGANEAPPSIISIFMGELLTNIFEQIKTGSSANNVKKPGHLTVGVDTLPPLPKDSGDRNRTSPLAFTGNKFEFRAVGSHQSLAGPLVALNTAVAESLDYICTQIEQQTQGQGAKADNFNHVVHQIIGQIITDHGTIIFDGDGYSDQWQKEAARRGLPNLKSAPEALPYITDPCVVELFTKYQVLSERELQSRQEIYLEQYCKALNTEAKLCAQIARTKIFPAAVRYQNELATTCANLKAVGYTFDTNTLDRITELVKNLQDSIWALDGSLDENGHSDLITQANHFQKVILPRMNDVRRWADELEGLVADDLWPLPTYQEMLFIK